MTGAWNTHTFDILVWKMIVASESEMEAIVSETQLTKYHANIHFQDSPHSSP